MFEEYGHAQTMVMIDMLFGVLDLKSWITVRLNEATLDDKFRYQIIPD